MSIKKKIVKNSSEKLVYIDSEKYLFLFQLGRSRKRDKMAFGWFTTEFRVSTIEERTIKSNRTALHKFCPKPSYLVSAIIFLTNQTEGSHVF